ncbi:hypothetical protein [Micromonospora sp. GCM10011541]|uniref:hypothetical protein n=1 Tax=Micromonospora TaxID=1873 RepID=UPI00360B6118
MVGVAARNGETEAVAAYLLPIPVDGLVIVASVSLVEIAGRIRTDTYEQRPAPAKMAESAPATAPVPMAPKRPSAPSSIPAASPHIAGPVALTSAITSARAAARPAGAGPVAHDADANRLSVPAASGRDALGPSHADRPVAPAPSADQKRLGVGDELAPGATRPEPNDGSAQVLATPGVGFGDDGSVP